MVHGLCCQPAAMDAGIKFISVRLGFTMYTWNESHWCRHHRRPGGTLTSLRPPARGIRVQISARGDSPLTRIRNRAGSPQLGFLITFGRFRRTWCVATLGARFFFVRHECGHRWFGCRRVQKAEMMVRKVVIKKVAVLQLRMSL